MPLIITSTAQGRLHGVYGLELTPPAVITATGTGTAVIVEALPWGPSQVLTYAPDTATLLNTIAPPGMSHTGGYLSFLRKGFARLGFVRVTGAGAASATATLTSSTPTNLATITAKYVGTAGNSLVATVLPPQNGITGYFNLTVSVTGTSGTTTDTFNNLNLTTGNVVLPTTAQLANAYLVGSITFVANGTPVASQVDNFSGGLDGTVTALSWTGTQGTANQGIALLEADKTVDVVTTGDVGNSLRAAVNSAVVAHADFMTDRMAVIYGQSGQTAAQAQADVASYRSQRAIYADVWPSIYDELGNVTLVPPGTFVASVFSQISPSTSIAWKAAEVKSILNGIVSLEANRGLLAADNTVAGIVTLTPDVNGGFCYESAKNTYNAVDPTRGTIKRTRMGHFILRSIVTSLRPYVDSPNVLVNQQDEFEAVQEFLSNLLANVKIDPNHLTHISAFNMVDPSTINSNTSIQAGNYNIGANVQISADQERIFIQLAYGETVQPTASVTL